MYQCLSGCDVCLLHNKIPRFAAFPFLYRYADSFTPVLSLQLLDGKEAQHISNLFLFVLQLIKVLNKYDIGKYSHMYTYACDLVEFNSTTF